MLDKQNCAGTHTLMSLMGRGAGKWAVSTAGSPGNDHGGGRGWAQASTRWFVSFPSRTDLMLTLGVRTEVDI